MRDVIVCDWRWNDWKWNDWRWNGWRWNKLNVIGYVIGVVDYMIIVLVTVRKKKVTLSRRCLGLTVIVYDIPSCFINLPMVF